MANINDKSEFGLPWDDFEGLKLYESDSEIGVAVAAKLKYVFERLFRNMGVDSNDFAFMCFHGDFPNAFFINKQSGDGLSKNIIAVSDSMIKVLDHEEELAALLAHECGHFIWENYIQGSNTIVQERWADVNSVDLMIDGGYNPLYILEMQKKVFSNFNYKSINLGVHGTGFARAEDVKAYLTKKALEQGDFRKIRKFKNKEWINFQQQIENIYKANGYNTYLEKVLLKKFKTKDVTKINRVEFLKVILDEFKSYRISGLNNVRIDDLCEKLSKMDFRTKSSEETILLQEIFNHARNVCTSAQVRKILKRSYLGLFGPFAEQYDNIKNFLASAYDDSALLYWAKKIEDLLWTGNYAAALIERYPVVTADGKDNIGKPLRYDVLKNHKNVQIRNIMYDLERWYNVGLGYNPDDYYIKDGIVTLYGDDAYRQRNKDEEEVKKEKDKTILEKNTQAINYTIDYYNYLSDYMCGKITCTEFVGKFPYGPSGGPVNDFYFDVFIPEMKALQQKWFASRGCSYFLRGDDVPTENPNIRPNDYSKINAYVKDFFGIKKSDIFTRRYLDAMYKLAQDLINENAMTLDIVRYRYRNIVEERPVSNDPTNEQYRRYSIYLRNLFAKTPFIKDLDVPKFVVDNFVYKEESQFLKNIINQFLGKEKIQTDDELLHVMKSVFPNRDMAVCLWAEFLRHGGRTNPIPVMEFLEAESRNIVGGAYRGAIADVFAQHISDSDFDSLMLYEQICLYEFMERNGIFSDEYANENKYMRKIVNQIVARPVTDDVAIKYTVNLLTRNPITPFGDIRSSDIKFFNEREKLLEFYANYWANKLGHDDGSDVFVGRVHNMLDELQRSEPYKHGFSDAIKKSLLNRISEKIVSQEKVAKLLGGESGYDMGEIAKQDYAIRAAEAAFSVLADSPNSVLVMIDFLSNKMTEKSLNYTLDYIRKNIKSGGAKSVNKSHLILIHENFWGADLPTRAYMMNRLMNSYSNKDEDKLNLVVSMYFDEKSEYWKDANLVVRAVYNNLQDYERNLIIAALASAGQRGDSKNMSGGRAVGRGLKMFLQNKGPAFIKFGQLLSYLPTLDADIRAELATLRDKANIPARDELFEILKMALPESEMNKISYVGKLLGAGSFYITVQIVYDGRPCVISVMRPYAHELTASGVDMIARTINDLVVADKKFAPLQNILNQARESAFSEIDIEQDYQKYRHAKHVYEQYSVTSGDATYSPDVAQWLAYGATENGANAYKIMEMASGHSLTFDGWTEQEKHDFAVAYVTLELALLLSGEKWDTDRHQGQQNFDNTDFRNFCIGIFDTGAQMTQGPGKIDKVMLGHLIYELAVGAKRGRGIGDTLVKIIKDVDAKAQKINIDTSYIDGVQRGLTALSDIIEYQKEQRDENGNVVQESRSLTVADFENIVMAIYESGVIDKTVERTVITKAVLDKLLVWRSGLKFGGKTKSDAGPTSAQPVVLKYVPNEGGNVKMLSGISKAQEEVEKILAERAKRAPIGMRDGHNNQDGVLSMV